MDHIESVPDLEKFRVFRHTAHSCASPFINEKQEIVGYYPRCSASTHVEINKPKRNLYNLYLGKTKEFLMILSAWNTDGGRSYLQFIDRYSVDSYRFTLLLHPHLDKNLVYSFESAGLEDQQVREPYSDWLEENCASERAEQLRNHFPYFWQSTDF